MYYYTVSIDENEMVALLDDLRERINAFSKRRRPFSVVVTQEQLDENMAAQVARFHLVVTPDFVVKNERQALQFCEHMKEAAEEIQAMNEANYVVVPPPSRHGGPGKGR